MAFMPDAPADLTGYALSEYERIAPLLEADGKVRAIDQQMIANYCRAIAHAQAASDSIAKDGILVQGDRGQVKNPALQIFRDSMATATALAKPLGITPKGRADLKVQDKKPATGGGLLND